MKTALWGCCTLTLALSSALHAEDRARVHLSLSGGTAIPAAPAVFRERWKHGMEYGLGLGVTLSSRLSVVGEAEYSRFSFNEADAEGFFDEEGFDLQFVSVRGGATQVLATSAALKLRLSGRPRTAALYALAGGGYSQRWLKRMAVGGYFGDPRDPFNPSVSQRVEQLQPARNDAGPSFFVGLGLEVPLGGKSSFFYEARYAAALGGEESRKYFPVRFGLSLGF